MTGSDSVLLFNELYGVSTSVVVGLSRNNWLKANQRAVLSAIAAGAGAASLSTPDQDNFVLYCLKSVMMRTQSG